MIAWKFFWFWTLNHQSLISRKGYAKYKRSKGSAESREGMIRDSRQRSTWQWTRIQAAYSNICGNTELMTSFSRLVSINTKAIKLSLCSECRALRWNSQWDPETQPISDREADISLSTLVMICRASEMANIRQSWGQGREDQPNTWAHSVYYRQ